MIYLGPTPGGEEGRVNNIHEAIIDWLSDDAVLIDWLIAGENVLDVVGCSLLVLVSV
jgi:hypothetical protein